MSPWDLGIIASSGGTPVFSAEVLVVNGGYNSTNVGADAWYDIYGDFVITEYKSGGAGGYWGTATLNIPLSTDVPVSIGSVGGGLSSFNGLGHNSAGFSAVQNWTNQGGTFFAGTAWNGYWTAYLYYAGGGNSATAPNRRSSSQNGAPLTTLAAFNNVTVSGGGGSWTTNVQSTAYAGSNVEGTSGGGTYGRGHNARTGTNGTAGVTIIKYSDSIALPTSGTFTSATTGGFRYVTCASSTTLRWG